MATWKNRIREKVREAVGHVLEGLACSIASGAGHFDFKLPFEVGIMVKQDCYTWTVTATTTLEDRHTPLGSKQEWLDELEKRKKRKVLEEWAAMEARAQFTEADID